MLPYFLLTLAIELPLYYLFDRNQPIYSGIILLLINCISWPILTVLYLHTSIPLIFLEIGVVILEGSLIHQLLHLSKVKSAGIAITLNIASVFIGRALITYL